MAITGFCLPLKYACRKGRGFISHLRLARGVNVVSVCSASMSRLPGRFHFKEKGTWEDYILDLI